MAAERKKPQIVIASAQPDRKGMGVFGAIVWVSLALLIVSYCAYLYDEEEFRSRARQFEALKPLAVFFDAVEKYSPFHEFLSDDDGAAAARKAKKPGKIKVFSAEELKASDGRSGDGRICIAFMGEVFDVTSGREHYGPGRGYAFFAGRDASRAFVTGQFDDEGLTDDVVGLDLGDFKGLDEWMQFYRKDYKHVGYLEGRYFDANGHPTEYHLRVQKLIAESNRVGEEAKVERGTFPSCNSRWSSHEGHRVWCTSKSGGDERGWVGVPRRLFSPAGRGERCACVKDFGGNGNRGDLDNPNLKEFPSCDPKSPECRLAPPSETSDEEGGYFDPV